MTVTEKNWSAMLGLQQSQIQLLVEIQAVAAQLATLAELEEYFNQRVQKLEICAQEMQSPAQIFQREMERTIKQGFCEDGEMTFEEYSLHWLDRPVKYAAGTIASYRRMLKVTYPFIGAIKLSQLRPIALENMLVELRKRSNHGKPVQEATVQKYLTVVSAVLSDAKRNEIIPKNPAHMIDLPDTEKRAQFIPTEEDANRFLNAPLDDPQEYKIFLCTCPIHRMPQG